MTKVLVLMGGTSEEREISLKSGQAVFKAAKEAGYQAQVLDLGPASLGKIKELSPDVVFIALHGKNGEDGTVQGYLDLLGIPYTGSGMTASAICMNKILTKKILSFEKLPTAEFAVVDKDMLTDKKAILSLVEAMGLPLVVKAPTQGSSIGTYIIREAEGVRMAIEKALDFDPQVLAEKYIDGIEVTASVIGNQHPYVLPLIEITAANDFYDYESKYTPGMCQHIIPARITDDVRSRIVTLAAQAYKAIGCRGFARVDFMVDKAGNPYILEINTVPGMTEMSLVPDAARADGISFVQLVDRIVKLALEQ